jgi:hypothetical protein
MRRTHGVACAALALFALRACTIAAAAEPLGPPLAPEPQPAQLSEPCPMPPVLGGPAGLSGGGPSAGEPTGQPHGPLPTSALLGVPLLTTLGLALMIWRRR